MHLLNHMSIGSERLPVVTKSAGHGFWNLTAYAAYCRAYNWWVQCWRSASGIHIDAFCATYSFGLLYCSIAFCSILWQFYRPQLVASWSRLMLVECHSGYWQSVKRHQWNCAYYGVSIRESCVAQGSQRQLLQRSLRKFIIWCSQWSHFVASSKLTKQTL